jgi:DNA-binding transcriptional LysR family regulator
LFERTTRQVGLTPFGAHLLPLINGVLDAQLEIRQAARDWQRPARRVIRIGFSPAVNLRPIHLALAVYHRDHAETEIVLKECLLEDLRQRLAAGSIDLALVVRPDGKLRDAVMLQEEPLVLLPRHARPEGQGGSVALKALGGETFVFTRGCGLADAVRDLFRRARVSIQEYPGQALSYRVVEEWADLGLGAGVLPRSKLSETTQRGVPLHLADGRPAMIRTYACWGRGRDERAPERMFLAWLSARTAAIAQGLAGAPASMDTRSRHRPSRVP